MAENTQEKVEFVRNTISEILNKLGVLSSLEFQEGAEESWFILKSDEAPLLIGEGGQNLAALNHVVRRIVEKKYGETDIRFLIDVNDYHKKHVEEIKDMARMHAQRVRYFKKPIEMRPMNAYERRIVHTVLQEYPDISTESTGEGMGRRVVIKPLNL
ncbi:hypothetical protein HYS99_00535 [Candidatus Giovannonibacteria bacterium]|nr:hypothetical protein [Candidatus Giovannonibacteria bacterium]